MSISVLNTDASLSGKTIAVCEGDMTVSGGWTFTGNQAFQGNISLGNGAGDTVTVTGTITSNLIFTDATYDVGASGATRPRDLYLSRDAVVGGMIRAGTADASDNDSLELNGGGATGATRGGSLQVYGNEEVDRGGFVRIRAGNVAGSGIVMVDPTSAFNMFSAAATGITDIRFAPTQVASSNANTLDDYEEDVWTVTDGSGAALAFTSVSGQYIKIGQLVMASASLTFPATADGSNAAFTGLPFLAQSTAVTMYCSMIGGLTSETTLARINLVTGDDLLLPYTTGAARITNATLSGDVVQFTVIYRAAA